MLAIFAFFLSEEAEEVFEINMDSHVCISAMVSFDEDTNKVLIDR